MLALAPFSGQMKRTVYARQIISLKNLLLETPCCVLLSISRSGLYLWISGSDRTTLNLLFCSLLYLKTTHEVKRLSSSLYIKTDTTPYHVWRFFVSIWTAYISDFSFFSILNGTPEWLSRSPSQIIKKTPHDLWFSLSQKKVLLQMMFWPCPKISRRDFHVLRVFLSQNSQNDPAWLDQQSKDFICLELFSPLLKELKAIWMLFFWLSVSNHGVPKAVFCPSFALKAKTRHWCLDSLEMAENHLSRFLCSNRVASVQCSVGFSV